MAALGLLREEARARLDKVRLRRARKRCLLGLLQMRSWSAKRLFEMRLLQFGLLAHLRRKGMKKKESLGLLLRLQLEGGEAAAG